MNIINISLGQAACLLALSVVAAQACAADDRVLLQTPITYDANAGVVPAVKEECHIEDMLATRVGEVLAKRGKARNVTVSSSDDAAGASVLRLTITHVLGVGGGAWSGPKAITVKAELLREQEVQRQQKLNRWSTGGFWGAFKSTCSILDRAATSLARDLGKWAFDPTHKIAEDEVPPKEDASAAPPPASAPASAPAEAKL